MNGASTSSARRRPPETRPPSALAVGGLASFSTVDWPGRLAATVFVQGCPWRCEYCHNAVLRSRRCPPAISWQDVTELLERRVGLLDAVVFSGGEPLCDPALPGAIRVVKTMGFAAGLHTAGIRPAALRGVLPDLDWVGLDVKTTPARYPALTGDRSSWTRVEASLEALLASGVEYECRTTFHPALVGGSEILDFAQSLADRGVENYFIQALRPIGCREDVWSRYRQHPMHGPIDAPALGARLAPLFRRFGVRAES